MELQEFIQQSDAWAESIGYSPVTRSADGSVRNYMSNNCTYGAGIRNVLLNGIATTEVHTIAAYMFIKISSDKIQFMHPQIMAYIDAVHDLGDASQDARNRIHHRRVLAQYKTIQEGNCHVCHPTK